MASQGGHNDERECTYGDMMLAIFAGRDPGGVLWQPRLEFWYKVNQKRERCRPTCAMPACLMSTTTAMLRCAISATVCVAAIAMCR